jgi:hypothetical protein
MAQRLLVGRESLHTDVHSAGEFVRGPTSKDEPTPRRIGSP